MTPLAYLRLIPGVIILVLIAWALRLEQLRARWQHQYQSEHAGRLADRGAYEQAQRDADAHNKAQVAAVEQQYRENSDNAKQAYLSDLARLRAERMRGQGAAPAQGSNNRPGSPSAPSPAGGTDGDGLHLSADQYLQAQEIELRLMHLQSWVEQQLAVDPNHP